MTAHFGGKDGQQQHLDDSIVNLQDTVNMPQNAVETLSIKLGMDPGTMVGVGTAKTGAKSSKVDNSIDGSW